MVNANYSALSLPQILFSPPPFFKYTAEPAARISITFVLCPRLGAAPLPEKCARSERGRKPQLCDANVSVIPLNTPLVSRSGPAVVSEVAGGGASRTALWNQRSAPGQSRSLPLMCRPPPTSFTGQGDAQQEPVGKLQSSLRVPELRHYECTTIRRQGLAGDDPRRVGKVCQLALRRPGGRLPDRSLERWGVGGGGRKCKEETGVDGDAFCTE